MGRFGNVGAIQVGRWKLMHVESIVLGAQSGISAYLLIVTWLLQLLLSGTALSERAKRTKGLYPVDIIAFPAPSQILHLLIFPVFAPSRTGERSTDDQRVPRGFRHYGNKNCINLLRLFHRHHCQRHSD